MVKVAIVSVDDFKSTLEQLCQEKDKCWQFGAFEQIERLHDVKDELGRVIFDLENMSFPENYTEE